VGHLSIAERRLTTDGLGDLDGLPRMRKRRGVKPVVTSPAVDRGGRLFDGIVSP
jgi:hypothetical protein